MSPKNKTAEAKSWARFRANFDGVHRYNRYLAVSARVVRRSLKEEKRLQAERRGEMDLRMAKWAVRLQSRDSERCYKLGLLNARRNMRLMLQQNGKQGEVKSVETLNQQAMAEHAGQSSQ